jgi:hypothetical protein
VKALAHNLQFGRTETRHADDLHLVWPLQQVRQMVFCCPPSGAHNRDARTPFHFSTSPNAGLSARLAKGRNVNVILTEDQRDEL